MELIIGVIVVVIIIFIVKNKKKSAPKSSNFQKQQYERKSTLEQTDHKEVSMDKVSVSIQTTSYNVDVILADGESVSMVDLGYKSESGGYVNWSVYSVKGKNMTTNRMNTKKYQAKERGDAADMAEADGLIGPYEIVCLPHPDEQSKADYFRGKLNEYGVSPPDGAVVDDLMAILNRVRYSEYIVSEEWVAKDRVIQRVRPIEGPNIDFAKYADSMGLKFSTYTSGPGLFAQAVLNLPEREKAALFAYCVLCNQSGQVVGDLRASGHADKLYEFAEVAIKNHAVLASIVGRDANDYLHPHKGSKAYKAVAEYFGL